MASLRSEGDGEDAESLLRFGQIDARRRRNGLLLAAARLLLVVGGHSARVGELDDHAGDEHPGGHCGEVLEHVASRPRRLPHQREHRVEELEGLFDDLDRLHVALLVAGAVAVQSEGRDGHA